MWPIKASIVDSDAPFSATRVANVCLRSCRRQEMPASSRNRCHPQAMYVACRAGSEGTGLPHGNKLRPGLGSPNFPTNHARCSARTDARSESNGIVRPAPLAVFARPTVITLFIRSTCPQVRESASPARKLRRSSHRSSVTESSMNRGARLTCFEALSAAWLQDGDLCGLQDLHSATPEMGLTNRSRRPLRVPRLRWGDGNAVRPGLGQGVLELLVQVRVAWIPP